MSGLKNYRKSLRKKFSKYELVCRFAKSKEHLYQFRNLNSKIMEILCRDLSDDHTFGSRNMFVLFALMNIHFEFLKIGYDRISKVQDTITLVKEFDLIIRKSTELHKLLLDNEKNPLTQEDLEKLDKENPASDAS